MRLECSYRQTIPPLQTAVAPFSENLPRRQSRRTLFWKHRWRWGLFKVAGWRPPASHRRKVRSIDCRADCAPVPRGLRENTQTNEHVLYLPQFTFFHSELGKGVERTDPPTPMSQGLKLPSTSGLG